MSTAAEEASRHIDRLLSELRDGPDPRAGQVAEELTVRLVQLYGDGLSRIAAMLGPDRLAELCDDPLVASLLLVHDLHPVPVAERIRQALTGTGVELAGYDGGIAHVTATAARCGLAREIELLVRGVAPEVTEVDIATAAPLLQVSLRPGLHS